MKNKFNIDDKVKVIKEGLDPKGVTVIIDGMQRWSDGTIHYGGKYKDLGYNGDSREIGVQFTAEQCSLIEAKPQPKQTAKSQEKSTEKPTEKPIDITK